MRVANVLAGLGVRELETAHGWYVCLLDREPDASPMESLLEWRFPGGGWLQIFVDAGRAGHGTVTLAVDDIGAMRARLAEKGHEIEWSFDGDVTSGTVIRDPDGNRVVFAQSMDAEKNPSAALAEAD